jgi:hypothetical protein
MNNKGLNYFIDVIGRSDFQGGYVWSRRQPDGSWKVWRTGKNEADDKSEPRGHTSSGRSEHRRMNEALKVSG